jgi:tetratricopeptide (TPR) repeat protein
MGGSLQRRDAYFMLAHGQGRQEMRSVLLQIALAIVLSSLTPAGKVSCVPPKTLEPKLSGKPRPDTYAELGIWYSDHQQYACASGAYSAGLRLEPDSSRLQYLLGVSLYAGGHPEAAVGPLQRSIELKPDVLKPYLVLAGALEDLRRPDEAKAQWQAALRIDPHSPLALDGLSKNLLARGDYASVIQLLGATPEGEPLVLDLALAYQKAGLPDQATEVLRNAMKALPSSERLSEALVTILATQAHYQEAVQIAAKSVQLHPRDLDVRKLYLHVLVLADDEELARPLAHQLLVTAPHDFGVLYLNGVLANRSGDYTAARAYLQEAITLNPSHYNSRYNLGIALAQVNDPKGAREQFEKALALGALEPEVRFEYAKILRTLGETKLAAEQLKLYQDEQKAKADRTLAASKSAQAESELAAGNVQEAAALYRDAVNALPQNAMLNFKLAMALDRIGDTTAEQAALEKAVQIDPDMAIAHNQLGYLASLKGDAGTAEEQFRQAVRAQPAYIDAWVSLAATLGMQSRFPEAQQAIDSALRLDPHNENALQLQKGLAAAAGQVQP